MVGPIVLKYDKRIWKKCIKCRGWHPREDICDDDGNIIRKHGFGAHADSSDGLQSICFFCKNAMNVKSRSQNVTARIRHHTGTRCLTQLGKKLTPPKFVANLEDYLGYKFPTLVKALSKDLKEREGPKRKLRDALNEGYHIDHKKPLSSFTVIYRDKNGFRHVNWDAFRECWSITNLRAIPADENLAKGATYAAQTTEAADSATSEDGTTQAETEDATKEAEKEVNIDITADTSASGDPNANKGGDPGAPD